MKAIKGPFLELVERTGVASGELLSIGSINAAIFINRNKNENAIGPREQRGEIVEEIVRVSCVRHRYPDSTEVFLCGLDFVVHQGERVVIVGPNGSGKTTLLLHVLGLLSPQEGTVQVFGADPAKEWRRVRDKIGVLLQNVEEQIIAPTVWDDISFSPRNYGYKQAQVHEMVEEVMSDLSIQHLKEKVPHYLSGGEKQKVALAGAMVLKPRLLILDEPFEGLDPRSKRAFLELLLRLQREKGTSLVVTTHDINLVPVLADAVYVMAAGGEIVWSGPPEEVFSQLDVLLASNLEPPVLMQLFHRLTEEGFDMETAPGDVEEATQAILSLLRQKLGAKTRD